ncbi:MAG: BamA/TamA family outer membrane protein, partial [Planctomycetota bacterium]
GALADPQLVLISEPPYPQEDLLAMLAFGRSSGSVAGSEQSGYLAGQAWRAVSAITGDRLPRPIPDSTNPLSRLLVEIGDQDQQEREGLPFQLEAGSRYDLIARAELLLTQHWSVISGLDSDSNPFADLQYRIRFGGEQQQRHRHRLVDDYPRDPDYLDRVRYEGRSQLGHGALDRALALPPLMDEDAAWSDSTRTDAAFRLRRLYRDQGYQDVRIDTARGPGDSAIFRIQEGSQLQLSSIGLNWVDVSGAPAPPPADPHETLRPLDKEPIIAELDQGRIGLTRIFTQRLIAAQASTIENILQARGFRRARVGAGHVSIPPGEPANRRVVHDVVPGPLYRITLARLEPAAAIRLLPEKLLAQLRELPGRPLGSGLPKRWAIRVRQALTAQGYQRASVDADLSLDEERHTGRIVLRVDPGAPLHVDGIRIRGQRRITAPTIDEIARLQMGELLTDRRMRNAQRDLLDTGLFRSVVLDLQPEQEPDGNRAGPGQADSGDPPPDSRPTDVILRIDEREPFEWRARIGYGTIDELRLGTDFIWLSPTGGSERIRVGGEANLRSQRVDAELTTPHLFGSSQLSGSIGPFWEHAEENSPTYDETLAGAVAAIGWTREDRRLRSRFGLIGARIEDHLSDTTDRVWSPFLELDYDRRDRRANPHRGFRLFGRIETADEDLGSTLSYTKFTGLATTYVPLGPTVTWATALDLGLISTRDDTASDDLPTSFRFITGGAFSVRGFSQDSLGPIGPDGDADPGNAMLVLRNEIRGPLGFDGQLQIAAFLDAGNAYERIGDIDLDELRYGAGYGFRFITPAGSLILDLGTNLDPVSNEDHWKVHFAFGFPF